jgi:branched-chain amino acid transport system substrate-binding protein
MRHLRFSGARVACALFALLVALLPLGRPVSAAPASTTLPAVDLPVLLPLTGNIAFIGMTVQRTLQAVERATNAEGGIQGHPVHFTFYDDQASPVTALQLVASIPKDAPAVFDAGPLATCRVTSGALRTGPVLYCLSPLFDPPHGSYAFSGSVALADLFAAEFQYFKRKGWDRIALVETTDASGQFTSSVINRLVHDPANNGLTLVAEEHFGIGDLSVAAQIANVLAAKPQVIILGANGNAAGTVLHGLHDAGNTVPVATSTANMTLQQMDAYRDVMPPAPALLIAAPRWAVPSAVRPGPVKDAVERFFHVLRDAGIAPDGATASAYDPAMLVIGALQRLGPAATATQVRDDLSSFNGPGSVGYYDFRETPQRGLTSKDTVMVCWDVAHHRWIAAP